LIGASFAHHVEAARRKFDITWHLDEVFATSRGEPYLLWRAVDQHSLCQSLWRGWLRTASHRAPRHHNPHGNSSSIAARNGGLLTTCIAIVQAERGDRASLLQTPSMRNSIMSKEDDNKAIVGRWFTDFWGKTCNLDIVDELAAPDMLLRYSLHEPRRGREDIKAFMTGFREAFPDLNFWGAADLIAEGDYVVGRWEGGGTHTGPAFNDFLIGSLPAATGRTMRFTGTTVLRLKDGKIVEEIGLDDGATALQQLGLLKAA
jgi:predicted ester cyclase